MASVSVAIRTTLCLTVCCCAVKFLCLLLQKLGYNEKPDFFVSRATVTLFKHDWEKGKPWYNACPGPNCNKKVRPRHSACAATHVPSAYSSRCCASVHLICLR
jgi:hypothetical protein